MKKIVSLLALSALVVSMAGCTSIKYNDPDNPYAGKAWRVQVSNKLIFTPDLEGVKKDFDSSSGRQFMTDVHLTPERFSRIRVAPIVLKTPGVLGHTTWANALVPDDIASEDLQQWAVVDVVLEKTLDYSKNQFHRVIRLVCRAGDEACLDRVKKDGTLFSVIDANPVPGDLRGLTYDRKMSPEDERRYAAATK